MAVGHPDWMTWAGRSAGAGIINAKNFLGSIAAGATGTVTFNAVPTGKEFIYQHLTVACDDDTGMHYVDLYRNSDSFIFYTVTMVMSNNAEFPGLAVSAGDQVKLEITNNAAVAVEFFGSVFWIERDV